ncbi:hypothetical protein L917_20201 [Phytophthora nicotianae]|uniref:Uncharacterized protein n=1 Tax=Phytophthora nicotianae TaxID=4792 RepID=W2HXD6_PHYNI|nr:hypothetical protein L916_20327 [Phytophthora nicotianae]ETL79094.1 hypothetical protein L917_20201 [Phytophthora nicotianae]
MERMIPSRVLTLLLSVTICVGAAFYILSPRGFSELPCMCYDFAKTKLTTCKTGKSMEIEATEIEV